MKSGAGKSISIDPAKHAASAHGVLGCKDCHTDIKEFPHPTRIVKVQCATCHADEAKSFPASAHSILGESACASCHGSVHELTTAENLIPGKCAECHAQEVKELKSSIHGQAAKNGDPDAPKCVSCHGPIHAVKASSEADSTVARKNLPDTCAKCHSDAGFLSRHKIPVVHPVASYKQSVHGRAVALGKEAATCSSCHGSHDIYPATDHAIQGQSLESGGYMCAMPQGNCPGVRRECAWAGSQGRCAGCAGLRRLPRRALDHGPEERGFALECQECLRRRPAGVAMAIRAWPCATICPRIVCLPTPRAITGWPSKKAK